MTTSAVSASCCGAGNPWRQFSYNAQQGTLSIVGERTRSAVVCSPRACPLGGPLVLCVVDVVRLSSLRGSLCVIACCVQRWVCRWASPSRSRGAKPRQPSMRLLMRRTAALTSTVESAADACQAVCSPSYIVIGSSAVLVPRPVHSRISWPMATPPQTCGWQIGWCVAAVSVARLPRHERQPRRQNRSSSRCIFCHWFPGKMQQPCHFQPTCLDSSLAHCCKIVV